MTETSVFFIMLIMTVIIIAILILNYLKPEDKIKSKKIVKSNKFTISNNNGNFKYYKYYETYLIEYESGKIKYKTYKYKH